MVNDFQKGSLSTRLGIPMIYGIDAVHGHNNVYKATIFPHNVGLGATRHDSIRYRSLSLSIYIYIYRCMYVYSCVRTQDLHTSLTVHTVRVAPNSYSLISFFQFPAFVLFFTLFIHHQIFCSFSEINYSI